MKNELPDLGTPEQAIEKMKNGYMQFIQSASMFLCLAEYYSTSTNRGHSLDSKFSSRHGLKVSSLLKERERDIYAEISCYACCPLEFVREIQDNLREYFHIIDHGQDESLSDYDKCCDSLTIRDEFIDLKEEIDSFSKKILSEKELDNNLNDPAYDPNSIQRI